MSQTLFDDLLMPAIEPVPSRRTKGHLDRLLPARTDAVGPFPLDSIHLMDCIEGMKRLPDACCDVAIADPPYNASKGGDWKWDSSAGLPGFGGDWSKVKAAWDDMSLEDYLRFTLAWLSELKRVIRPSGSIWIHGTYHNIGLINFALQLLEIEIINEVVWYKRNSFPNLSGRRLTASHETILWAHTGGRKRRYFFDYDAAKRAACPEDGLKEAGKQMRTVWDIPNNKDREELHFGKHPTQKPVRLLTRMLQISACPGGVLLVPFAGSGSDCVAASTLGLHYLGFETSPEYVALCHRRLGLKDTASAMSDSSATGSVRLLPAQSDLRPPRKATTIPSLIKWTGSKRSQALRIAAEMVPYRRYIEPFLGGGALLFLAARPGSLVGDVYEPLVGLWKLFQAAPDQVIENYRLQWELLQKDLPAYYYRVRERFNQQPNPLDLNFLMRTCVNGIVRFNDRSEFNNSFHLSRRGMEPSRFAASVMKWSRAIEGVEFVCQDYQLTLNHAGEDDFVYLDPPYAGNQQRYVADLDVGRLWTVLEDLNARRVRWALSFDGRRGGNDLSHDVPQSLYKRHMMLASGNSAVHKVLNGPIEQVEESLYLNY